MLRGEIYIDWAAAMREHHILCPKHTAQGTGLGVIHCRCDEYGDQEDHTQ